MTKKITMSKKQFKAAQRVILEHLEELLVDCYVPHYESEKLKIGYRFAVSDLRGIRVDNPRVKKVLNND